MQTIKCVVVGDGAVGKVRWRHCSVFIFTVTDFGYRLVC